MLVNLSMNEDETGDKTNVVLQKEHCTEKSHGRSKEILMKMATKGALLITIKKRRFIFLEHMMRKEISENVTLTEHTEGK